MKEKVKWDTPLGVNLVKFQGTETVSPLVQAPVVPINFLAAHHFTFWHDMLWNVNLRSTTLEGPGCVTTNWIFNANKFSFKTGIQIQFVMA